MSLEQVTEFVDRCIRFANSETSCLTAGPLSINGMSSDKVRHLLNNLCSRDNTRYLEVGSWRGSTLVSALFCNPATAVAVDNFSQFATPHPKSKEWLFLTDSGDRKKPIHPKKELHENLVEFVKDKKIEIIDGDCQDKKVLKKISEFEKFNVYFYDGDHSYESQKKGILNYLPFLEKHAIVVVDDWNATDASNGTLDALKDAGKKLKYLKELKSKGNCDREGYWNGIGIIIFE